MKYYLGLDNGGTTTKAALFDEKGREVCVASTETTMIVPRPNFTERDMEEMWDANCSVVRQVLEKAGVDGGDVAAIAVCGHGKGLYLWGKDGKPAYNGIISTDNRAYNYPKKWRADGTAERVRQITAQDIMACQPVCLLAWMRDNESDVYKNIQYIFECKDYVRFRLTGEARAELTDYSGANLVNLFTRQYDEKILECFGISEISEALPPLCLSSDICGYITQEAAERSGLKEGTPVAGGMFDIDACALAVGVTNSDNICMIAGTWSINEYLRKEAVLDRNRIMNSLFCLPEYYLIEESSATSAGNFEWFIKTLLPEIKGANKNVYDVVNEWVSQIDTEEICPIFLPFLMASNVHPNAKGSFIGISNYHTRAHICRSVYEGIAFSHKYHLEKLLMTRDEPPKSIRLAGGVTNSRVWVQMFADIMELPIEIVDVKEAGAAGCAIVAAVAVGDYPNAVAAAEAFCVVKERILPRKTHFEIYRKKYSLYVKTINALDGIWSELQEAAQ